MPLHRSSLELPPILAEVERRGFLVFTGDRGYDLNIVGCRSLTTEPNRFDDFLHVSYKLEGRWIEFIYACTTDPGQFWLDNPMRSEGTAIVCHDQQIRGCFVVGSHRGRYQCLVQAPGVSIKCWRDNNRDEVLDFSGQVHEASAIQIHKAGRRSINVEKWSAGCTVLQHESEFHHLMGLVNKQIDSGYGSKFTYTILQGIYL